MASTEQLPPACHTNLQFAVPKVLPCSHQELHHKPCNSPLELMAFQVEVEGLNFFLHLNHMHKAAIAATPQSLRHCWSPAPGTQRKHHPPVNSMWKQGGRMKKGTFSFLFPMEGAEGQKGSVPQPMSSMWDLRVPCYHKNPQNFQITQAGKTLSHLPVPCSHQSCTQTTSCPCFCGENVATQDFLPF